MSRKAEIARETDTGLVDLRGREDEPTVRALLAEAHGSSTAVEQALECYGQGDWRLLGWLQDGRPVACAGVSRDDDRSVVLHSLVVAPEWRRRGIGRALLETIADHVGSHRLVAETDGAAAELFRGWGFDVEQVAPEGDTPRFRCIRTIVVEPGAPEAVHAVTLTELERAIRSSWALDTSDDPDEWTEANPARGQCVGTALVVRELLGGAILLADVIRDGAWVERHAWNRLTTGVAIDLTRAQFRRGETLGKPVVGEPVVAHRSRYDLLAARVRERLAGTR